MTNTTPTTTPMTTATLRVVDDLFTLRAYVGPMYHGGDARAVARQWAAAGITPDQAEAYIAAECWCSSSIVALQCAGIRPADLEAVHAVLLADYPCLEHMSVGYAHSNHDIATDSIVAAVGRLQAVRS